VNTDYFFFSADVGFVIPNLFVVGYALDYNEYFRDLNVRLRPFLLNSMTFWRWIELTLTLKPKY